MDDAGRLVDRPISGAEPLPGRFVVPGLVDSHAHPAIMHGSDGPIALDAGEAVEVLSRWSASGISLVRDVGSRAGMMLEVEPMPGLPKVVAAGRFLAPADRYFPILLPDPAEPEMLTELALGELARGASWVEVIADFAKFEGGVPSGALGRSYPRQALAAMVEAVHLAGGRVAVHCTTNNVADLVRDGVDSIEHGSEMDEESLALMAETGTAWTPTLHATLSMAGHASDEIRRSVSDVCERLRHLLPLAVKLGVPVLAGSDAVGSLVDEIIALAQHGMEPAEALAAASSTARTFLGEAANGIGGPATLVTYAADPRQDLAVLSSPSAVIIGGTRVRCA